MSTPLIKEFHYNVPAAQVWQALTDTTKMRQWYFPQLQQFEPVAGYRFRFSDNNAAYQKEWVVTKVITGRTLAHSWAYKDYPGSSEVIFDISAGGGDKTTLKVTQTGLESFPNEPHFKRGRFEWGWDSLLDHNLRHLLEQ